MAKYSTYYSGVENGQVIKSQDMVLQDRRRSKRVIHHFHHRQSLLLNEIKNLYASVDLDLYKAILGGDITIDTLMER
jgi:curved DNA-binding protein